MRFGERFQVTIFGASHGPEVGVTISGLPPGTPIDLVSVQSDLDRRRPVGRRLATRRREEDRLVVDSGYLEGRSDGSPFRAHVANEDARREPYDRLADTPRPGHADYPARVRFGPSADLSGGGIFSGRMTVGLVIAGAVARSLLGPLGIDVVAFARSIGGVEASVPEATDLATLRQQAGRNEVASPDPEAAQRMEDAILSARRDGDSVGGVVEVRARGLPVGMGEPFFDSVESVLAHAWFAIPAVKAVEFGAGFGAARMRGSEHNDPFVWDGGRVRTTSNHAGGVLGGLTTGMPIVARLGVKPTSSIAKPQQSVNLATHAPATVSVTGRHDPCIVPRAVVVVESVTCFVLADLALRGGFVR
ncbi:MAG TPA: chorismate synthase [Thermoplasmata archaeon]|nr:chorismate synthase [Thermoplasmata archaeon]